MMGEDSPFKERKRLCQLTSLVLCSLFWISQPLKEGLIGCPKTNYHSTLQYLTSAQTSLDFVMQTLVWHFIHELKTASHI